MHCTFFLLKTLQRQTCFPIPYIYSISQDPCFLGCRLCRVQIFHGLDPGFRSSPKVNGGFKFFTFKSWYLCLQFFVLFKYQCKEIYTPNLIFFLKVFIYIMIFVFREVFIIHNNLVTQKISYIKIISLKWCLFFVYKGECVLICLNIGLIFILQTSFSLMLVENDRNLIVAKNFLIYTIITEKSLWDLRFSLLCYMYIFFVLYWAFLI